jgi:TolB-like protein/DNA-binding winged helix-turn-helix (wHTH) protein/Tfp pilus assembly protein PilF
MEGGAAPRRFRIGEWLVDSAIDEIRSGERLSKLEPRTMRLLCVLAERPGEVWSADELLARVWPGVMVTQSSVYQAIAQLRRELGDDGEEARYIATVPRRGYRLVAAVEPLPQESAVPTASAAVTPAAIEPVHDAQATASVADEQPVPRRRASDVRPRWSLFALAAVIVVLVPLAAWWTWRKPATTSHAPTSVAVLPFADLSDGGKYQPFCDGLSEELLNALARVPGLRVTGRNSSFQFRGVTDARDVGRQLGVSHVIEGSVAHSGERLRVMAQLVDTRTGFQVWSNAFDRPRSDALAVQSEISRAVVAALELQLSPQAENAIERPAAMQVNAYDLYLLGRHQQLQRNAESMERAIAYYQQAIAADPKFALAHAGLADAYITNYYYTNRQLSQTTALAQPEIDAALRLDPELAEAYSAWSVLLVEQKRNHEAIAVLKRAIAINSNYGEAYLRLGYAYENDGQLTAALAAYDQVAVLDPLNTSLHVRRCLLLQLFNRFADARRACDRGFELQPDIPNALWAMALAHVARGELDLAVERYQAALQRAPARTDIRSELAIVYLDLGMPDSASRELATVRKQSSAIYFKLIEARVLLVRGDQAGLRQFLTALSIRDDWTGERVDAAWLALAAGDESQARRWSPLDAAITDDDPYIMPSLFDTRWSLCAMCSRALLEAAQGDASTAARHRKRMLEWFDGLAKQGGDWHGMHYLRGVLHAQAGDREAAFRELQRAVELGWRRGWLLKSEPALRVLHQDPRYAAMLARIEADTRAMREKVTTSGRG